MKPNQAKLKTTPRTPLFSCGFFRQCTQTVLSPTTTTPPPLPHAPPPPTTTSSSSSSSNSFTQWRFPLSTEQPSFNKHDHPPPPDPTFEDLFHVAEHQFASGSQTGAIQLLERSLVPNARAAGTGACTSKVMCGVVSCLRAGGARKAASKVLLALCLVEENRRVALEAGAVNAVVDALTDAESGVAERALAALELLCTVEEGAAEVRTHALAVPMMVEVMGRMEGRGKEHAMSILAVIYGGLSDGAAVAPAEEVARAVTLALQGDCSARGRRKGAQLLKILRDHSQLDGVHEDDNKSPP